MGEMFGTLAKHYHEGGWMMHPILVSLFVAVFAVYPFAAELYRQSNIPKRLLPGAIALDQFWFGIEQVQMTRTALHEQGNHGLRPRRPGHRVRAVAAALVTSRSVSPR